ncbi:Protein MICRORCHIDIA 6 [Linum grandiflorum]
MVSMQAVKVEPDLVTVGSQGKENQTVELVQHQKYTILSRRQESEENRSANTLNTAQTGSSVLEQVQSPVDDTGVSPTSTLPSAPLCRQFWKAGSYNNAHGSKVNLQSGKNYLHVHPMFLHSNATSHKWAFGAIAELLDNAIDEIQNGASFVIVDKISSPRDGLPALLIQDDGGGMNPEAMRRCMSFGFSDKKSAGSIGQYGNGFKTSTMRLGADVIVFTRHMEDRTASIGLLSYTFLMQMGHDRIIVPMVDYEFNTGTNKFEVSRRQAKESFKANLSLLMRWSPYSTETELLKQFDDIGLHGTKVVIYNLWCNDDGNTELDFHTDHEDIRLEGGIRKIESLPAWKAVNEQHISNRLHHSLHAYMSILYLQIPENFRIMLRGKVVKPHNLADDLIYPEYILYKPQCGGLREGHVITTVGFLNDAPRIAIHGFNVYHKNRLIQATFFGHWLVVFRTPQPFMQVVRYADSRGRGVVGILEANFIKPTHNKQDFERTSLFQKLEVRLKEMTFEYWDRYSPLIGYQAKKKVTAVNPPHVAPVIAHTRHENPVMPNHAFPTIGTANRTFSGVGTKRKEHSYTGQTQSVSKISRTGEGAAVMSASDPGGQITTQQNDETQQNDAAIFRQDSKRLRADLKGFANVLHVLYEYETRNAELNLRVIQLTQELKEANSEYNRLWAELNLQDEVKEENPAVNM